MSEIKTKTLSELLAELPGLLTWPPPEARVTGVSGDSRRVKPGQLFVARAGDSFDGHHFIPDAVMAGATVIAGEWPAEEIDVPVPYLRVRDGREALAWLSAAWYDFPARRLVMIGVTGTDGKTTTVNLLYHILQAAGLKAGMISTVNAVIGDQTHDTGLHVTTPDSTQVQRYLSQMVAAGTTHAILEATSHGLAQHRVSACDFDIAAVTNITHEHLDYHGDWETYLAAKMRLFEGLNTAQRKPGVPKLAVLNADDASYTYLSDLDLRQVVRYGLQGAADVTAREIRYSPHQTTFVLHARPPEGTRAKEINTWMQSLERTFPVSTSLVGAYNVSNILAAASVALGLGLSTEAIQAGIAALQGIPGRMERVSDTRHAFLALVDFAHTPNALRQALKTARSMTGEGGRVITVWGSAGLRDREKRRLMGRISAQLADLTVITAEDPRTEPLADIIAASAAACAAEGLREGVDFWRVKDRGQALRLAVELARPGDVVIACGKGHEQSMCFGTTEYPWDDRRAMRLALEGQTLDSLPTARGKNAEYS